MEICSSVTLETSVDPYRMTQTLTCEEIDSSAIQSLALLVEVAEDGEIIETTTAKRSTGALGETEVLDVRVSNAPRIV